MPAVTPVRRLRRPTDVHAAFRAGSAAGGRVATVHVRRRQDDRPARVAVVADRRLGSAVVRNRAKRRLRAAIDQVTMPAGCDFVVVARSGALHAEFRVLCRQLADVTSRATARVEGS